MSLKPSLENFLGALVIALGAGLGWAAAIWLVGVITRHLPI
jgi:hypothetical protein